MKFVGFFRDNGNNDPEFIFDESNNIRHTVDVVYKDWELLFIVDGFADDAAGYSFWTRFSRAVKRTPNDVGMVLALVEDMAADIGTVINMPAHYFDRK
jgi:hypothetical protein